MLSDEVKDLYQKITDKLDDSSIITWGDNHWSIPRLIDGIHDKSLNQLQTILNLDKQQDLGEMTIYDISPIELFTIKDGLVLLCEHDANQKFRKTQQAIIHHYNQTVDVFIGTDAFQIVFSFLDNFEDAQRRALVTTAHVAVPQLLKLFRNHQKYHNCKQPLQLSYGYIETINFDEFSMVCEDNELLQRYSNRTKDFYVSHEAKCWFQDMRLSCKRLRHILATMIAITTTKKDLLRAFTLGHFRTIIIYAVLLGYISLQEYNYFMNYYKGYLYQPKNPEDTKKMVNSFKVCLDRLLNQYDRTWNKHQIL